MNPQRLFLLLALLVTVPSRAQQAPDSLLQQGRALLAKGDYIKAETHFSAFTRNFPDEGVGFYELAKSMHLQGKKGPAKRTILKALNQQPEEIHYLELQHKIGFQTIRPLELAKKRAIITQILELDSTNAYANFDRGNEYAQVFLHNRNRINVPELRPFQSTLVSGGYGIDYANTRERDVENALPPAREPFNIRKLRDQGYLIRSIDQQAREAYPLARRYLQQALKTDSTSEKAYISLLSILAANRDHVNMMQWAARMYRTVPQNKLALLYLGYALHRLGRYDEAAQSFEKGIASLPENDKSLFRDIRLILPENTEPLKDEEAFWQIKDPRMLSYYNERKLEHYARLVYSELLFSEPAENLAGRNSDRGMIHIRYGIPEQEYFMSNMIANCGGRVVSGNVNSITNFHVFDYGDFQLAFGIQGNFGDSGTPAHNKIPPLNNYSLYTPCGDVLSHIDGIKANYDSVIESENKIKEEPDRYNFAPSARHVSFPFLVSSFSNLNGASETIVSYGIPLSADLLSDPLPLGIQTGSFVVSAEEGRLSEDRYAVGSVPLIQVRKSGDIPLWNGVHRLDVPPGEHSLSVEFETTGGTVVGFQRKKLNIPSYNDTGLQISDILLAFGVEEEVEEQSSWQTIYRKGYAIQPAPSHTFFSNQPLYTYLEFYNLSTSNGTARYRIEAIFQLEKQKKGLKNRLRKMFGRSKDQSVAIQFEEESRTSNTGRYFILDLADKLPGSYTLTFTLTDLETGSKVSSSREVIIN